MPRMSVGLSVELKGREVILQGREFIFKAWKLYFKAGKLYFNAPLGAPFLFQITQNSSIHVPKILDWFTQHVRAGKVCTAST